MTNLDRDLVVHESEQLLAKPVTILLLPLLRQELDHFLAPLQELVAVTPDGIRLWVVESACQTRKTADLRSWWESKVVPCMPSKPFEGPSCSTGPALPSPSDMPSQH